MSGKFLGVGAKNALAWASMAVAVVGRSAEFVHILQENTLT